MRNITELQEAGNKAGREKLELYSSKPCWTSLDWMQLKANLEEEVRELDEAWFMGTLEELRHEAADIRNTCDMIIQKCDKELK